MGRICVLFIKDGTTNWAAQGLEYDIAAQGKTIKEAMKAFEIAVGSELAYSKARGLDPFEGINPAPQRYWDIFEKFAETVDVSPSPMRAPSSFPFPQFQTRVA